jgi:hypothetical protein
MMNEIIRQGDVLLREIDTTPKNKRIAKDKYTLALGEITGHHHDILGDVEIFRNNQSQILVNVGPKGALLTHQEHAHLQIPEGMYEVVIQREFTALDEVQAVRD